MSFVKYWTRTLLWVFSVLTLVSCGETEKKRRTLGYKGEAKNNPFLAAERFLEMDGLEVDLEHGLSQFEDEVAVIFLPPSSVNTVGRAKRLEKWVRGGGHLVLMLDGGELGGNDFRPSPNQKASFSEKNDRPGVSYFLKVMGLEIEADKAENPKKSDKAKSKAKSQGEKETEELEEIEEIKLDAWEALDEKERILRGAQESQIVLAGFRELEGLKDQKVQKGQRKERYLIYHWSHQFIVEKEVLGRGGFVSEAGEKKHRFLSAPLGDGRVTWLTDAHPLRNRFIAEADHAHFLKGLIDLSRPGRIIFSKGEGEGLFALLWRHFPLAVLSLLILVVLWLWRHLPRFGPPKDVPTDGLREFSGQVRGVGRFLWRQKREDAMLNALRAQVTRQLSLGACPAVDKRLGADLADGVFELLAGKTGLSVEAVKEAMTREAAREPGVMVRMVKNLQKIRSQVY